MSSFPGSPRILKGGIVLVDPSTLAVQRTIALQYNPDTITRTLQVQGAGPDSGDHLEALRLKGPPIETIKVEAEIDAADQLEDPDSNSNTVQFGIAPQLAALEIILYPSSSQLQSNLSLASFGTIEIAPAEAPLPLFVWSKQRVMPIRLTEFSITEEAFDVSLNPIRAKISLGMRVLSINDLGPNERATSLYLIYQQQKEQLAAKSPTGSLSAFGISRIS